MEVMALPDDLPTIGDRLRYVREQVLQMGTHALAAKLLDAGVEPASNAAVTRYEKGERQPQLEYVAALSRLSGVPTDWMLLNRTGDAATLYVIGRMRELLDSLEKPTQAPATVPKRDLAAGAARHLQQLSEDLQAADEERTAQNGHTAGGRKAPQKRRRADG